MLNAAHAHMAKLYHVINLSHMCSEGACSGLCIVHLSVNLSDCPHVFSQIVAVVDTKHGYVGWYNGRSAQQESRVVLSKKSMFLGC